MNKNSKARNPLDAESMLVQKTNEDFNKKKPDPTDPNESKNKPDIVIPDTGAGSQSTIDEKTPDTTTVKKGNKTDGSE